MPGKHAPESPASFYLSVGRAAAGAVGVLGLVIVIAMVAVNSRAEPSAPPTTDPTSLASAPPRTRTPPTSPTTAATQTAQPVRPKSEVRVSVLNGTGRAGLARSVADDLEEERYDVIQVDNGPRTSTSTVYYRAGAKPEAQRLLRDHPELGRIRQASADSPGDDDAMLVVLLGADYTA